MSGFAGQAELHTFSLIKNLQRLVRWPAPLLDSWLYTFSHRARLAYCPQRPNPFRHFRWALREPLTLY